MFSKIRLCALNDDSSEESDHEPTQESVKQAKVGNYDDVMISDSCTCYEQKIYYYFFWGKCCVFLWARNICKSKKIQKFWKVVIY